MLLSEHFVACDSCARSGLLHAWTVHAPTVALTLSLLPLPQDASVSVAPKKANWDLRRDVEDKLAKLERRTQRAMVELMQEEEQQRLEEGMEAGG